ncbi:hypothetical protein LINPERPRIM_LOCUS5544 [Linum perenne]
MVRVSPVATTSVRT